MTTIYVKEQGAVVGRNGERLVVRKGGAVLEEVPIDPLPCWLVVHREWRGTPRLRAVADALVNALGARA